MVFIWKLYKEMSTDCPNLCCSITILQIPASSNMIFRNQYDVKEREMAFHPVLKLSGVELKMFLKSDLRAYIPPNWSTRLKARGCNQFYTY